MKMQDRITVLTTQIETMLQMQDELNAQVTDSWQEQDFPWYRAAWIELAEAMEHHGWKWWKQQEPDLPQLRMELVDVFHFMLSNELQMIYASEFSQEELARTIAIEVFNAEVRETAFVGVLERLERLAGFALTEGDIPPAEFVLTMTEAGMDFDTLFLEYVGKNTLNRFRQTNGYKDGTYIKDWNGQEDNEYLSHILDQMDPAATDTPQRVYSLLEQQYAFVTQPSISTTA